MKPFLVALLLLLSTASQAQECFCKNLLNRTFYEQNLPAFRPQGAQSGALRTAYGADFLPLGTRYVQVYNFATYYSWFLQYFPASFRDRNVFEAALASRDEHAMKAYLEKHRKQISELSAQAAAAQAK